MDFNGNITLNDLNDKQFKIRLFSSSNNDEAILRQYIQNIDSKEKNIFKQDAVTFAKEVLKIKYPAKKLV